MDDETLERLLIDRHLGELSEDAGALLAAYLTLSPDHARQAEGMADVLTTARRALRPDVGVGLLEMPPLSRRLLRPASRAWTRPRVWFRASAIAAALAIAFLMGGRLEQRAGAPSLVQSGVLRPTPAPHESAGFWSLRRWKEEHPRRPAQGKRQVEWLTPLGRPKIGDRT